MEKIVSGGQTGVDRAALDTALELGLSCGGWCPRGRKAEDGVIDARYPLTETESADYDERTRCNVRDSDATLILNRAALQSGTALTVYIAQRLGKPYLIIDLDTPLPLETIAGWLGQHKVRTLNVAGPRESRNPGIYDEAKALLRGVLADL